VDTAGLRDTTDQIEEIGIERSWREIDRADVVLHLVDARDGWLSADDAIEQRLPRGVEHVVVANKIDLAQVGSFRELRDGRVWIGLSAQTGDGVALLQAELLRAGGWRAGIEDSYLARERHLQALQATASFLGHAQSVAGEGELFAEELRLAQSALSKITGQFLADDLLGEIFSRFCIGK
jgi:tRNA modification GTPase